MTFTYPQHLVETAWLEAHLNDPDLRILDCTVLFATDDNGVRVESGRDAWTQSHIPGSGFADLMQDLSDQSSALPFMMPPAAQFAEAMSLWSRHRQGQEGSNMDAPEDTGKLRERGGHLQEAPLNIQRSALSGRRGVWQASTPMSL